MLKFFIYLIFIVLYFGVTFFGVGPVLLADGHVQERVITLLVVILIYFILTAALILWRTKAKK